MKNNRIKEVQNRLGLMYVIVLSLIIFIIIISIMNIEQLDKMQVGYEQELSNVRVDFNLSKINRMILTNQKSDKMSENEYLKLEKKELDNEIKWSREQLSLRSADKISVLCQTPKQRIILTQDEYELFAHLVMAESGSCSKEYNEAVASVIINRVLDDRFPDNMKDVIYQKRQFSPVFDGSINNIPNSKVYEAINTALCEDTIQGCIGFANIELTIQQGYDSNAEWLSKQDILKEIDNVSFYNIRKEG